jgi:hypothetical protein
MWILRVIAKTFERIFSSDLSLLMMESELAVQMSEPKTGAAPSWT